MKYLHFCLMVSLFVGCTSSDESQDQEGPTLPVVVSQVVERKVPIYLEAIGSVSPWNTVEVRPQVEGKLLKIHVGSGEKVKKGKLLYTIEPKSFQAALDKAKAIFLKDKAVLVLAENKVARYSELRKQDFVSQLSFEELETDVEANRAQVLMDEVAVEQAKINLEYCSIRAAMDGKISGLTISAGNIVSPKGPTALTILRQLSPVSIRFTLAQKDFQEVKKTHGDGNMTVEIFLPEEPETIYKGDVYFIDNTVDCNTGTIVLKGYFANENEELWPGEFVRVRLLVRTEPDALLVPKEAVVIGQQGPYVYVVTEDQTAVPHPVKVGKHVGKEVLIEKGIEAGQTIVVDGQLNLFPGVRVIATNETQAEEA